MERSDWIKERRRETEERYDLLWSARYDLDWGIYSNTTHQQFIHKFLNLLPQPGLILDAACGAGRYMSMLLEKGHSVIGIDQAQGMLSRARVIFPTVPMEKIGLQEMPYADTFNGAICMDALEHVSPEDWELILSNFQRALKSSGYFYFTVEIAEQSEIDDAFSRGQQLGLPIVYGEWADGEVYHYYPPLEQVKEWIQKVGFVLVEEGEGDGYRHFVVRKA